MPCKHETLNFIGEQKTDDGVNTYYQCGACGTILVVTPTKQVVGIPGTHSNPLPPTAENTPKS